MTFNQQMITKYASQYVESFTSKFGTHPQSWFSFFRWLSSFTSANSFDDNDVKLAIKLLAL